MVTQLGVVAAVAWFFLAGITGVAGEVERPLVDLSADFSIKKAFYINVDGDKDRQSWVEDVLKMARIKSERMEGFIPNDFDKDLSTRKDVAEVVPPTSVIQGESGYASLSLKEKGSLCSDLSHRLAYRKVAEQGGEGWYLVTEDDIAEVGIQFNAKLIQAMKKVPEDFCMLRVGYIFHVTEEDHVKGSPWYYANRRYRKPPEQDYAILDTAYYGAHAILLRADKAAQLVAAIKKYPLHSADRWTANDRLHGECPSYVLGENLIKQKGGFQSTREGKSDIAKEMDARSKKGNAAPQVSLLQPPPAATSLDDLHVLSA